MQVLLRLNNRIVSFAKKSHLIADITVMLCHALAINILRSLALKSNETSQYSARSAIDRQKQ